MPQKSPNFERKPDPLDPYPNTNRKLAILNQIVDFDDDFGHFYSSYLNELVPGILSDQLQIHTESSWDIGDEK